MPDKKQPAKQPESPSEELEKPSVGQLTVAQQRAIRELLKRTVSRREKGFSGQQALAGRYLTTVAGSQEFLYGEELTPEQQVEQSKQLAESTKAYILSSPEFESLVSGSLSSPYRNLISGYSDEQIRKELYNKLITGKVTTTAISNTIGRMVSDWRDTNIASYRKLTGITATPVENINMDLANIVGKFDLSDSRNLPLVQEWLSQQDKTILGSFLAQDISTLRNSSLGISVTGEPIKDTMSFAWYSILSNFINTGQLPSQNDIQSLIQVDTKIQSILAREYKFIKESPDLASSEMDIALLVDNAVQELPDTYKSAIYSIPGIQQVVDTPRAMTGISWDSIMSGTEGLKAELSKAFGNSVYDSMNISKVLGIYNALKQQYQIAFDTLGSEVMSADMRRYKEEQIRASSTTIPAEILAISQFGKSDTGMSEQQALSLMNYMFGKYSNDDIVSVITSQYGAARFGNTQDILNQDSTQALAYYLQLFDKRAANPTGNLVLQSDEAAKETGLDIKTYYSQSYLAKNPGVATGPGVYNPEGTGSKVTGQPDAEAQFAQAQPVPTTGTVYNAAGRPKSTQFDVTGLQPAKLNLTNYTDSNYIKETILRPIYGSALDNPSMNYRVFFDNIVKTIQAQAGSQKDLVLIGHSDVVTGEGLTNPTIVGKILESTSIQFNANMFPYLPSQGVAGAARHAPDVDVQTFTTGLKTIGLSDKDVQYLQGAHGLTTTGQSGATGQTVPVGGKTAPNGGKTIEGSTTTMSKTAPTGSQVASQQSTQPATGGLNYLTAQDPKAVKAYLSSIYGPVSSSPEMQSAIDDITSQIVARAQVDATNLVSDMPQGAEGSGEAGAMLDKLSTTVYTIPAKFLDLSQAYQSKYGTTETEIESTLGDFKVPLPNMPTSEESQQILATISKLTGYQTQDINNLIANNILAFSTPAYADIAKAASDKNVNLSTILARAKQLEGTPEQGQTIGSQSSLINNQRALELAAKESGLAITAPSYIGRYLLNFEAQQKKAQAAAVYGQGASSTNQPGEPPTRQPTWIRKPGRKEQIS